MNDPTVVRIVVTMLGVLALAALGGTVYLEANGHQSGLSGSIATGALGALAGILSTTNTKADPAMGAAMAATADASRARTEADLMRLDAEPPTTVTADVHLHGDAGRADVAAISCLFLGAITLMLFLALVLDEVHF